MLIPQKQSKTIAIARSKDKFCAATLTPVSGFRYNEWLICWIDCRCRYKPGLTSMHLFLLNNKELGFRESLSK